ncbi:MAG: CocE/NonD family hydrolase [Acidobacteria bacterium]|nr:CocE/NonD family hydrolase [Acidobacteriota bacterium]
MLTFRRMLRAAVLLATLGLAALATAQSISTTVPAPDGTPLATDVYLPPGWGPWPIVLIRTPYGKSGEKSTCMAFEAFGYGCVAQDTRGRFASRGQDTVFRDDGPDGRATVAWIAGQPWCDGAIGTFGASALGITQYMMAPGAPAALRCQIPIVATPDLYSDAMFQGGVLRHSLVVNWLSGQGSLGMLDQVLEHRLLSSWWDPVNSLKRAADVTVPALHMGGWFDIFEQGTLDAFSAFQHHGGDGARGRQYLVIGPWTHRGFGQNTAGQLIFPDNAVINLVDLWTDFLGHWLKGDANGVDRWPAVRVYLMGAVGEPGAPGNRWIDLDDWPPATVGRRLYLAAPGGLEWSVPPSGDASLTADPQDPVPTLGGANLFPDFEVDGRPMGAGPYDERPIEARDDVLVFSTPPLERPLTVMGRITARIWLVPQTPDLDVAIRLTDVYPDGRSMLLCDGISRARYHLGRDREAFLTPGSPVELTVDLWSTAMVFAAGHRIRISVSGSNSPRFEVNPNDGTNPGDGSAGVVAHSVILLGGRRASFVELPVVATPRRSAGRVSPASRSIAQPSWR